MKQTNQGNIVFLCFGCRFCPPRPAPAGHLLPMQKKKSAAVTSLKSGVKRWYEGISTTNRTDSLHVDARNCPVSISHFFGVDCNPAHTHFSFSKFLLACWCMSPWG